MAHHYKGMWQHVQYAIDEQRNKLLKKIPKLNKKLDSLAHKTSRTQSNEDKEKALNKNKE